MSDERFLGLATEVVDAIRAGPAVCDLAMDRDQAIFKVFHALRSAHVDGMIDGTRTASQSIGRIFDAMGTK